MFTGALISHASGKRAQHPDMATDPLTPMQLLTERGLKVLLFEWGNGQRPGVPRPIE